MAADAPDHNTRSPGSRNVSYIKCENCMSTNEMSAQFCRNCGRPLNKNGLSEENSSDQKLQDNSDTSKQAVPITTPVTKACPNCNKAIPYSSAICIYCQKDLGVTENVATNDLSDSKTNMPLGSNPVSVRKIVRITSEGKKGQSWPLEIGEFIIGRKKSSELPSAVLDDEHLSSNHALMCIGAKTTEIEDCDSTNGTFVQIKEKVLLVDGDVFSVGHHQFRFHLTESNDSPTPENEVEQGVTKPISMVPETSKYSLQWISHSDELSFPLKKTFSIGSGPADIELPNNVFVAHIHAEIHLEDGKCYLTDSGSKSGTYIKIKSKITLANGTYFICGKQVFLFEQEEN